MKTTRFLAAWLLAAALGGVLMTVGCESTETEDAAILIQGDFAASDAVQLGQITFTASLANSSSNSEETLVLPLVWSVSRSGLGRFLSSAGLSAVYEAYDYGVQSVRVEDQIGRAGVLGITQIPASTNTVVE